MATGFKMKSWSQVVSSMSNWFAAAQSQVTDLNVGGVVRTFLEAVAGEIAEIYYRIYQALFTAQEEAIYQSFSFERKPATYATGVVLWQRTSLPSAPINIPAGSQVAVPATGSQAEIAFESADAYTLPTQTTLVAPGFTDGTGTTATLTSSANIGAGDILLCGSEQMKVSDVSGAVITVSRGYNGTTAVAHSTGAAIGVIAKAVPMAATVAGAAGNVAGGAITKMNTLISGLTSVTNEAALAGGADEETDDARKKRFQDFIAGIARGTKGAIEFGAKLVPGVVSAHAIDLDDDPSLAPGFVNLYIADAAGTATPSLIAAVNDELNNWRPAGVSVTTTAPSIAAVDVTAALTVDTGFALADMVTAVRQRLTDYLATREMGQDVFLALLYTTIVETNPVGILNAHITVPGGDTTVDNNEIARAGTITVTAAYA